MDFTLPEEIAAAAASVGRFAEAEIAPVIAGYEERREFPHPIIEKMGAAGFFGAAFPEELGGSSMGYLAVAAIAEELSRLAPEFGYAMNMQAMTCPFTIYNWGDGAQVLRFVPDLIAGRKIGMFALSEPGGGSDAAGSMKTTAPRRRYVPPQRLQAVDHLRRCLRYGPPVRQDRPRRRTSRHHRLHRRAEDL